jgi:Carboxypeptidase regulatory-like domain
MLGVMVRLPEEKQAPPPVAQVEQKPPPPPPPVKAVAETTSVRIVLSDQTGHPISDASVRLEYPATETAAAKSIEVPLLSTNLYVMDGLPLGEATLTIKADLLEPHSQPIKLIQGPPSEVSVTLQAQATQQSQLRGLVRSYSGQGIAASVSITPGTHGATCDQQGEFEIKLPPGNYEVTISADGFQTQKRSLRVQDEGVTVLNADLQKE